MLIEPSPNPKGKHHDSRCRGQGWRTDRYSVANRRPNCSCQHCELSGTVRPLTLEPTVSEPTVSEIIEKAKQLCRLDGILWSNLDFQNPMAQQRRTARMADVAARRRYLKR